MKTKFVLRRFTAMMGTIRLPDMNSKIFFLLISLLGFALVCNLYLVWKQSTGVHIRCDCGSEVTTEERVAKYLNNLMDEIDLTTNRTAQESILATHPSLAIGFLTQQERRGWRCSNTPGIFSIKHRNSIWQEADIAGHTFLLYGAYYDDRDRRGPLVRILGMVQSTWPPTPTCHMWYKNDVMPTATRAINIEYVHWQERLEGHWLPYIVTCRAINNRKDVPHVVSLVGDACSPSTNALRIHHKTLSPKKDIALCHKFFFNPAMDFSKRLVEWIENLRAWGVDHLTVYDVSVHPNVEKVMHHYQKSGFLSIYPWANPGSQAQLPHLYRLLFDTQRYTLFTDENIPYTDCLLRSIGTHRFVGVWDIDEFIFPVSHAFLAEMLDAAKATASEQGLQPTSYLARCTYYFDDKAEEPTAELPEYLHMLRHVVRTVKYSPPRSHTKAFHDTSLALGLHAHFALLNLDGPVDRDHQLYNLYPGDEAHLAHYRHHCQGENQTECQEVYRPFLVRDTTIWRYKEQVASNTKDVLQKLQLIPL
ncbi:uncharacterized protein [Palaemon carinicauda]|uniref:uncharacterized protein n=1 Tax=Palaemon carinicauda TaxID=392227 RepID=UPI0035B5A713